MTTNAPPQQRSIVGTPPTLEWIGVDVLAVDDSYQRTMGSPASKKILAGMRRLWDWRLCQPLVVSRRDDGSLNVVDGQHRLTGARDRGDIPHLPCVIITGANAAEEAATFVALNDRRAKLSQYDIFHAAIVSGDPDAIAVMKLLDECGLVHARHSATDRWKPREINCGPMLARSIKTFNHVIVRNALTALAEAYPATVVTASASVLRGLFIVYRDFANKADFDPDDFIEAIGAVDPEGWLTEAREIQIANPSYSRPEAMAEALMDAAEATRKAAA